MNPWPAARYKESRAIAIFERAGPDQAVRLALTYDRLGETLPGHLELIEESFTGLLDESLLETVLYGMRTVRDAVNPCATAGSTTDPVGVGRVPAE